MDDGILMVDPDQTIAWANAAASDASFAAVLGLLAGAIAPSIGGVIASPPTKWRPVSL